MTESEQSTGYQRPEHFQDIVSNEPGFLIRWGNLFFLGIFLIIAIACWFVRYPDIVPAPARLTSINAPKPVISLIGGKLVKMFIVENQFVKKGEILGYVESTAIHTEVFRLISEMDSLQTLLNSQERWQIKRDLKINGGSLGELQSAYQTFTQACLVFKKYESDGFYLKQRAMLLKDWSNMKRLHDNIEEKRRLYDDDLSTSQKTFEANEALNQNQVISDFDFRNEKSKLINKKLSLPEIRSALISNESQQNEKEKEILELDNTIAEQHAIFQQALNTLKSQVDSWLQRYTLIAPITGKIAFASFVQENQQLQPNQNICFINPENSQYFAEVVIPQSNLGKVAIGQRVLLKFESYPFQEYGSVIGQVDFVSHISYDKGYSAKVTLTDGLTTTNGTQIQYRDGLSASAEIITRDLRLPERFYYTIVRQLRD